MQWILKDFGIRSSKFYLKILVIAVVDVIV